MFEVSVYTAYEARQEVEHAAAITKDGAEPWNLDDIDYVLTFRKLRDSYGNEEGIAEAIQYAALLFPGRGVCFYPLGDKHEIVTVHHA
jgi:hypothetical protein